MFFEKTVLLSVLLLQLLGADIQSYRLAMAFAHLHFELQT